MREVKPIKDAKKLLEIETGLADYQNDHEKRIYLLFMIGICTGLRIGDLIALRVREVNHGDKLRLQEEKTGKRQEIKIIQPLREVLDAELEGMPDYAFLFPSRQRDKRGRLKHITTATAENDMKLIAKWFNIDFPFSCHSLRKTYGYWHFQANKNLPMLARHFNHSDLRVTARYIGLDDEEEHKAAEKVYKGILPPNRKTKALKRSNQLNAIIETKHHDRTKQKAAYAERMRQGRAAHAGSTGPPYRLNPKVGGLCRVGEPFIYAGAIEKSGERSPIGQAPQGGGGDKMGNASRGRAACLSPQENSRKKKNFRPKQEAALYDFGDEKIEFEPYEPDQETGPYVFDDCEVDFESWEPGDFEPWEPDKENDQAAP